MSIHLDIATLSIICVLLALCYCIGLLLIQQLQPTVRGISTIAFALLLLSVSFLLLSFGNQITHWISKILANSLMAFSYIILLWGVCQFRGFPRKTANIGFYTFPVLIVGLTYFTFFMPSTNARVILMSTYVSSLCFITIVANQKGKNADMTPSKYLLSIGLATQGIYNLFRFIWTLFEQRIDDFMISGTAHQLAFVSTLLMIIFIGFSVTWMLTGRLVATIYDSSLKDELTRLYNRRALEEFAPKEAARAQRYNHALSIVLVDIDNFKLINDIYGHQTGDHVLRTIGRILRIETRKNDYSFRYGGEEFLILLPETDHTQAQIVAEKLRRVIERTTLLPSNREVCTASFGVSEYAEGENWEDSIKRADKALYKAKRRGRNRVEVSAQP